MNARIDHNENPISPMSCSNRGARIGKAQSTYEWNKITVNSSTVAYLDTVENERILKLD